MSLREGRIGLGAINRDPSTAGRRIKPLSRGETPPDGSRQPSWISDFFTRPAPIGRRKSFVPCAWGEEIGGRLVGVMGLVPDGDGLARIRWLHIDPEWRHTQIPSKLIEGLRNQCRKNGCFEVVADAAIAPGWVWRRFQRHGFEVCRLDEGGKPELRFSLRPESAA